MLTLASLSVGSILFFTPLSGSGSGYVRDHTYATARLGELNWRTKEANPGGKPRILPGNHAYHAAPYLKRAVPYLTCAAPYLKYVANPPLAETR